MLHCLSPIFLCWHTEQYLWAGGKFVHLAGGAMEREGSTGSGPDLLKGEDDCAFAVCRKSILMNYFPCISWIYFLKLSKQWICRVKFIWLFELSVSWVEHFVGVCQKSQWGFSGCSCCSEPFSTGASRRCVHHLMKSSLIIQIALWATSVKWQRWYKAEWNSVSSQNQCLRLVCVCYRGLQLSSPVGSSLWRDCSGLAVD